MQLRRSAFVHPLHPAISASFRAIQMCHLNLNILCRHTLEKVWKTNGVHRCVLDNWDQLRLRSHLRLQRAARRRSLWRQRRICLRHRSSTVADSASDWSRRIHRPTSSVRWFVTTSVHPALAYGTIELLNNRLSGFLRFAWVVDDAKCIVVTRVCVCVCLCVCPRSHAYTIARTRM